LTANLDVDGSFGIPLRSESVDSILASLLISYLVNPLIFLAESFRILRPGGRLVVSVLRRDADISKIYVEGLVELKPSPIYRDLSDEARGDFEIYVRKFLNDASHILDLDEDQTFRFWDADELSGILESAGFVNVKSWLEFGDPPQAIAISATRPNSQ
jgi:SAM-dependent methyltransferase